MAKKHETYDLEMSDEEWQAKLDPARYEVLRRAATEPAFVRLAPRGAPRRHVRLRRLRPGPVPLGREVRLRQRLAELRPGDRGHDRRARGQEPLHAPHRDPLLAVRRAPRPRLRRRADRHGAALLRQLARDRLRRGARGRRDLDVEEAPHGERRAQRADPRADEDDDDVGAEHVPAGEPHLGRERQGVRRVAQVVDGDVDPVDDARGEQRARGSPGSSPRR